MADNLGGLSTIQTILLRGAIISAIVCVVTTAPPVLFVMLILVAIAPETFSDLIFGHGTTHVQVDANITYDQPRTASQHARRTSPTRASARDGHPPSPPRPQSPEYTWVRRYNSPRPASVDASFAAQQPYTWRTGSGYVATYTNIAASTPPYLPPATRSEPTRHHSRGPNSPIFRNVPYSSMNPSPPRYPPSPSPPRHRRRERVDSDVSWDNDDRLPPARPREPDSPSRPEHSRRITAESMPGLIVMVDEESEHEHESEDEVLPIYERPPEYDDERHSRSSSQ
ncbi:hypothetical protein E4T38_03238 [Aureobasidium subglaciale]|nr:hypothetical protein E4T38_03238 [Aureobasidium subglaciale]KAI5226446.1 hypothetical protein E4T40_03012 [Aureobasidium subglaciale]KAI5229907.1 hypothetical protein E4T41_03235 [Aureobasidium subglaciale]KAI5264454.1 hypothetical protein E4T46_03013 [Aureobasidium subglaciale]